MFSAFNTFGRLGAAAGAKSLAQQIAAMSPSLWLEPSVAGGYQDSAGTTALYMPGAGSADPPVGKAMDLSGNGNHALQATSTARPKLSARVNYLWQDLTGSTAGAGKWWKQSGVTVDSLGNGVYRVNFSADGQGIFASITGSNGGFSATTGATYIGSVEIATESGTGTITLKEPIGSQFADTDKAITTEWTRVNTPAFVTSTADAGLWIAKKAGSVSSVLVRFPQLELGSTATAYQRVTNANTYDYTGWPLIHQFDGVDDVLNVTFPSSLGSDCTVVTANQGTTPTILTGQTIGTSYTITATNAGRLVFPRALTAAETAIVTKWATQKGALP